MNQICRFYYIIILSDTQSSHLLALAMLANISVRPFLIFSIDKIQASHTNLLYQAYS